MIGVKLLDEEQRLAEIRLYERCFRGVRLGNIPSDHYDADVNQVFLPSDALAELTSNIEKWREQARRAPTAWTHGYEVAADYGALVKGWTTLSKKIVLQNRWQIFVLYNYPQSVLRRNADRRNEWLIGDHMRKPRFAEWKSRVESRSIIPTIHGIPEDFVAMPFIPSLNAYDIIARAEKITNWGDFSSWRNIELRPARVDLSHISTALAALHRRNLTWGEAILPNVIFTQEGLPIWVDAEMRYEGLSPEEERATDLRNLIVSASGAINGKWGINDALICQAVVCVHPEEVLVELEKMCRYALPLRQRLLFDSFGKYRLGAKGLAHFERVRECIRVELDRILACA